MTDDLASLDVSLDGAAVLAEAHATLTRYVVFPSPEAADAVTLYAAATHAMPALEFAARLVIKSPVKRCGKSRLLDVLGQLVARPLTTADISAAALVRSIPDPDKDPPPTVMLDEADAIFGRGLKGEENAEHLRGILNAGFGRDRPYKRWDITTRRVEDCVTFAMAVLAGIGSMPDTIEDRAVVVSMRRKAPYERAAKYRIRRDKPRVTAVGDRLAGWVQPLAERVGTAEPAMPDGLNDRAEDVWEALLAVADLAGGDWPVRARTAAVTLSAEADAEADVSMSLRLLADLRAVFGDARGLHTATILDRLCELDEAPWGDWYGRRFNDRDLAKMLRDYKVKSRDVREGGNGDNRKGYRADDLAPAWSACLPRDKGDKGDIPGQSVLDVADVDEGDIRDMLNPLTSSVADVADPPVGMHSAARRRQAGVPSAGAPCHRYGDGGSPLCTTCQEAQT